MTRKILIGLGALAIVIAAGAAWAHGPGRGFMMKQMIAKRGTRTIFHSNAITTWSISDKGEVKHVYA